MLRIDRQRERPQRGDFHAVAVADLLPAGGAAQKGVRLQGQSAGNRYARPLERDGWAPVPFTTLLAYTGTNHGGATCLGLFLCKLCTALCNAFLPPCGFFLLLLWHRTGTKQRGGNP